MGDFIVDDLVDEDGLTGDKRESDESDDDAKNPLLDDLDFDSKAEKKKNKTEQWYNKEAFDFMKDANDEVNNEILNAIDNKFDSSDDEADEKDKDLIANKKNRKFNQAASSDEEDYDSSDDESSDDDCKTVCSVGKGAKKVKNKK